MSVRIGEAVGIIEKTSVDSGRITIVSVGRITTILDVSTGVSRIEREGDGVKMLNDAVISEVDIGRSSDETAMDDIGRKDIGDIVNDTSSVV